MKEVLILLFLIISVTSNPIPQCQICQQNPYNPPCSNPSQINPCIQAATVQNALPNRDELNQLLMSKIMSNQCVQKILDPKLKLFNQNGEEIQRQNTPNVVNNYFILPPEVFLEELPKKKKGSQKTQNIDVTPNIKKKNRGGRKRKLKSSAKLIKPEDIDKQDENQDSELKKVKSRRKKNSRKSKNVKSTKIDSSPVHDPVKNNEEENLPTNNKKKRKRNRKPKAAKDDNGVTTTDKEVQNYKALEYNNHELKNIESPIDNFEVTKDLMENKLQARNSMPDFNWPQNINSMPEDIFNGFFPYMDMNNYFSPYSNYRFDFGQFYQPSIQYPRKRKNRRKYDNNNGEPHVLEIKLKPKDENSNSSKINPNSHVLQIKLKPRNKQATEVSTENPTELNYAEIELQLDSTDLEEANLENLEPVTEVTEKSTEEVEIPQNETIQEYEESLDSLEIMEEEPNSTISLEQEEEGEQENEEKETPPTEVNLKIDSSEDNVPDSIEIENVETFEEPKTISEEKKADVKEVKIEFEREELQENTPELGKEDKVPTMYSNGIINDYYPIFYDDAFYASDENNYHLKDLDDRLFYVTEGQEESFNRDRRKYDKYDYKLPNNIEERMKMRRNFINNMKNYKEERSKSVKNEENFHHPPLLENPGFVSKKIETKSHKEEYDRPFYISKYPEEKDEVYFDVNSSKDIETVYARSKVVKYGVADSRSEEDINVSDSASREKAYVVTARSMGPVEDFYWK